MAKQRPSPAPAETASADPPAPDPIDPRSDAIVLVYVGGAVPRDVPGRDLHGGDLARILYVRALREARQELDVSRPQGAEDAPLPHPRRQGIPAAAALERLATQLTSRGVFARVESPPAEPATSEA